jgi:UDP-N-acetylmuramoyl-L-alanyl-D-glutamate--2,6-diaminopimelate ligase
VSAVNDVRLLAAQADALVARLGTLAGITSDSRAVAPQIAFAAYPGVARDGRAYIDDAIARGAAAVLFEARGFDWNAGWRVPHVAVADLRDRLGFIAAAVYGRPTQALWMIGVTGTNGKTSCAHWTAQALSRCGRRVAIVGTLGTGFVDALQPSSNTTPDACVMQRSLGQWRRAGAEAVAMEVSSHGLDQRRVDGIAFDVALFTNLTRDHLDYHATMDAYGAAKARLFAWPGLRTAVINEADAFGRELVQRTRARGTQVVTYGTDDSDIAPTRVDMTGRAMVLQLRTARGDGSLAVPLAGAFNVQNVCGVLGVLLASDVGLDDALRALSLITPPPGRMQRFGGAHEPLVIVDYAHTPDALEKVLAAMRPAVAAHGVLVCVFGAGGDRDRGKRAPMGEVAARLADRVIVTSDNPRGEDPQAIADAIGEGIAQVRDEWIVELDRARAIAQAVRDAREGDVIVVAGKGHEDYQEANGIRRAFSDAACVAEVLSRRRAR